MISTSYPFGEERLRKAWYSLDVEKCQVIVHFFKIFSYIIISIYLIFMTCGSFANSNSFEEE